MVVGNIEVVARRNGRVGRGEGEGGVGRGPVVGRGRRPEAKVE